MAETNQTGFPLEFVSFDMMSDASTQEVFQLLYNYNQALVNGDNPDISSSEWNSLYPYIFNAARYNQLAKTVQSMETFLLTQVDQWIFNLWNKMVGDSAGTSNNLLQSKDFWTAIRHLLKLITDFQNEGASVADTTTIGGMKKYIESKETSLNNTISDFVNSGASTADTTTIGGFIQYLSQNYVPNSEIVREEVQSVLPNELLNVIKIVDSEEDLPADGSEGLVEGTIYLVPME